LELNFPQGTVRLSTDAEIGSSGSPVFDEQGRLVAITRLVFTEAGNTEFVPYSTQGIDLAHSRLRMEEVTRKFSLCR
jgi:hypothetical protein